MLLLASCSAQMRTRADRKLGLASPGRGSARAPDDCPLAPEGTSAWHALHLDTSPRVSLHMHDGPGEIKLSNLYIMCYANYPETISSWRSDSPTRLATAPATAGLSKSQLCSYTM